jgi:hypothetical protein
VLSGGFRKLARVAVLAVAAIFVWAVAPALSTTPYVPRAVDFEQQLGGLVERAGGGVRAASHGGPGHAEGQVRFRTPPIRAPRRFDMVGVARHIEDLEYRTRRDGEPWSGWVEAADGSPVWAGGADWVQVRSRGARFSGRLHYVNVTGTDTPLQRLLTGVRSAVSSVVAGGFGTDEAIAGSGLRYVPRSAWGAERKNGGCLPRAKPSAGKVKLAAVHHTVSTNDYTPEMGPSVVLGICSYHRNANGWNDIGYNALVDRFGVLYEGRAGGLAQAVIGAHAAGWNSLSTGVALIGNHTIERPGSPALAKLVKWLAWKVTNHGWPRATGRRRLKSLGGSLNRYPKGQRVRLNRVLTHRHLNSTQCAGDGTEPLMKRIRRRIQNTIERWGGEAPALVPTEGQPPAPEPPPDDGGIPPAESDTSNGGTATTPNVPL